MRARRQSSALDDKPFPGAEKKSCTVINKVVPVLMLTAACVLADAPRSISMDGYAALVNARVITVGDVLAFLGPVEEYMARIEDPEQAEARLAALFEEARDALIEQALIVEDFKRREREIPERVIEGEVESTIRDRFAGDRATFFQALAAENMTYEDWRQRMREGVMLMALRYEALGEPLPVAPRDIKAEYERRIGDYTQPEEVRLAMLLIHRGQTSDNEDAKRAQIEGLRQRIVEGEEFSALTSMYSEGPRADRGGDLGWMVLDELRPILRAATESLQPGETSEVLADTEAFYLIRLEGRKQGSVVPFEEVRARIEQDLIRQREEQRYREWISRLRQRHHVRVF